MSQSPEQVRGSEERPPLSLEVRKSLSESLLTTGLCSRSTWSSSQFSFDLEELPSLKSLLRDTGDHVTKDSDIATYLANRSQPDRFKRVDGRRRYSSEPPTRNNSNLAAAFRGAWSSSLCDVSSMNSNWSLRTSWCGHEETFSKQDHYITLRKSFYKEASADDGFVTERVKSWLSLPLKEARDGDREKRMTSQVFGDDGECVGRQEKTQLRTSDGDDYLTPQTDETTSFTVTRNEVKDHTFDICAPGAESSTVDTFLDIDTGFLGSLSLMWNSESCQLSRDLATEESGNYSSEKTFVIEPDKICESLGFYPAEMQSSALKLETKETTCLSEPDTLFKYSRCDNNESKILRDEMIFEPSHRVESKLYLCVIDSKDEATIEDSVGVCNNNDASIKETQADIIDPFSTNDTIRHFSFPQFKNNQAQKQDRSKDGNLKFDFNSSKAKSDSSSIALLAPIPKMASDIRDDCIKFYDRGERLEDRPSRNPSFKLSFSAPVITSYMAEISRDEWHSADSRLRRKVKTKKKAGSRRRPSTVVVLCNKKCWRNCPHLTRRSRAKQRTKSLTVPVPSETPLLHEIGNNIVYEKKGGKFLCRGIRRQAENINFNSGEIKPCTNAKASSFIGEYLFELWKNQCLCDVKIQSPGSCFLAHKLVLAAFSDSFCPSDPTLEPSLSVDVPNTTADAVYQVLMYLYTSEMELSDETMEDVLNVALYLGVSDVIELIKDILQNPTKDNFLQYLDMASRLHLPITLMSMPQLVRENLQEISDTKPFKELAVDDMVTILTDQELLVTSESDILEAVCKWAEHSFPERIADVINLLQHVNFVCIEPEILAQTVERYEHIFDHKDMQQLLAHIYKSFAVNSEVKESNGFLGSGLHDEKHSRRDQQHHYQQQLHGKLSDPPGVAKSSVLYNDVPGGDEKSGARRLQEFRHSSDYKGHSSNFPNCEILISRTTPATHSSEMAAQATKKTIKSIDEQFMRVFGANRSMFLRNFCRSARVARGAPADSLAEGNTSSSDNVPTTTSPEKQTAGGSGRRDLRGGRLKPPPATPPQQPTSKTASTMTFPKPLANIIPRSEGAQKPYPRSRIRIDRKLFDSRPLAEDAKTGFGAATREQQQQQQEEEDMPKNFNFAANLRDRCLNPSPTNTAGRIERVNSLKSYKLDNDKATSGAFSGKVPTRSPYCTPRESFTNVTSGNAERPHCSRSIQRKLLCPCLNSREKLSSRVNATADDNQRSPHHRLRFESCDNR